MKELLFAMAKEKDMSKLKAVYEKYSAIVPVPLSSQFPDRPNKIDAVKHHIERTQKETTKLYPSAKRYVKCLLYQRVCRFDYALCPIFCLFLNVFFFWCQIVYLCAYPTEMDRNKIKSYFSQLKENKSDHNKGL